MGLFSIKLANNFSDAECLGLFLDGFGRFQFLVVLGYFSDCAGCFVFLFLIVSILSNGFRSVSVIVFGSFSEKRARVAFLTSRFCQGALCAILLA